MARLRNASYPEVLEPYIDDMLERFAKLQPATLSVKAAIENESAVKAEIAAALVVVWHEAKRTNTFETLYNSFKNAKGTTDTVKFINYLADGRLVNERMAQAVNEMGSVIAALAPCYSLVDEPDVDAVLAEINKQGGVSEIHNAYEKAEIQRQADEREAADRKVRKQKEKEAADHGMTFEQYVKFERSEKQREQHERNTPKRQRLLEKLLAECEVLRIDVDVPDSTVLVVHKGKVLKLTPERSLTILDAVA